jgi:hypothetical protein
MGRAGEKEAALWKESCLDQETGYRLRCCGWAGGRAESMLSRFDATHCLANQLALYSAITFSTCSTSASVL